VSSPRAISIGDPQIHRVMSGECTVLRRLPSKLLRDITAGQLLWVREPFWLPLKFAGMAPTAAAPLGARPIFLDQVLETEPGRPRPTYTLPKRWHRQHLRVIEVRRKWLQSIGDAEIRAEGFGTRRAYELAWERTLLVTEDKRRAREGPLSWQGNPEVLVIRFERIAAPIDPAVLVAEPKAAPAPEREPPRRRGPKPGNRFSRPAPVRIEARAARDETIAARQAWRAESCAREPREREERQARRPAPRVVGPRAPSLSELDAMAITPAANGRQWCDQCERRVTPDESRACSSRFCPAKPAELAA
jgi:hypothetical protein